MALLQAKSARASGPSTSSDSKFGGLELSDVRRSQSLEQENSRLKALRAKAMLDDTAQKRSGKENGNARHQARSHRPCSGTSRGELASGVFTGACKPEGNLFRAIAVR